MCLKLYNSNYLHKNNFIVNFLKSNITSNNACNLKCIQRENVKSRFTVKKNFFLVNTYKT